MYIAEQNALIYIIKQFPKMDISYEQIEHDLHYITAKTLYNYAAGRTKPKCKKFSFLKRSLHERYPYEYNCAKAEYERACGRTVREQIEEEMRTYITL